MDGNREEDVVFNEKNVEKLGFVNYITVDQDKICSQCADHRKDCTSHSLIGQKKGVFLNFSMKICFEIDI